MSDEFISNEAHFEKIYLASLLKDQDFYAHVFQDLTPEMFPNVTVQRLLRILISFTKETGSIPGELIHHEVEKHKDTLPEDAYNSLKDYINELMAVPIRDTPYLIKENDKFIRNKYLKNMVPKLVEFGRKGDHDSITQLFQDYIAFRPAGLLDPGIAYSSTDIEERILRRQSQSDTDKFLFLIPQLDSSGVCFTRKNVVIIQSQKTSVGKTAMLLHLAKALAIQDKKVMIYSMEEDEEEISDRLDQTITGLKIEDLMDRTKVISKLRKIFDEHIRIKEFEAYDTTVDQLIGHHNMLKNYFNFHPDVILINASDDLTPKYGKDNLYLGGRDVARQLKAWAKRENIAIVADMQSNRGAAEKAVAGTEDAQGSIARVQLATMVISLNRSPAEAVEGMTSIHIGKSRFGKSFFTVSVHSDLARGQIYVATPE